jgi:hypothetical protein
MDASSSFKTSVTQCPSARFHMPICILVTVRFIALLNARCCDVGVCSDVTELAGVQKEKRDKIETRQSLSLSSRML